jgi:ribosomal protein L11
MMSIFVPRQHRAPELNQRRRALAAVSVILVFLVSCSQTPDRIVLDTLQTSKATADSAMRVLASLYANGRTFDVTTKTWSVVNPAAVVVSEATKARAISAYDKFAGVAKTTALALKAVGTQQQADALTRDLGAALSELLSTLRQLGVNV